jgi:hypothetical protein
MCLCLLLRTVVWYVATAFSIVSERTMAVGYVLVPHAVLQSCCCCFAVLMTLPLVPSAAVSLQERPSLSVLFPVVNRAVDPAGRLHTSLLANWVYGSSRLSSAVAEAVAALGEVALGGGLASNASE